MVYSPHIRLTPGLGLALALIVAAALYWPGLSGDYLFDDMPNIVDNKDLQINAITTQNLVRAALSSPSSEFRRPLASLSFAANFYLTGLDPFWMKLTNLAIHLLNGILVYALALALIRIANSKRDAHSPRDARWIALLISASWMVLPINLTGVLYVVQRMESLANLFVLLGLLGYISARQRMLHGEHGFFAAAGSLITASIVGLLSKETAAMTILYAATIEWVLFDKRESDGRRDPRIVGLFFIALIVPLAGGLIWQLPKLTAPGAWDFRNYDLSQRLLTETRVVVDYIQWTLFPTPKALSFYHDNYLVSRGWLQPWSTLLCAAILAALAISVIVLRKRAPLIALGLALFLGAQILTGTILPLELVYEHRNYFASFGLLLALIPILASDTKQFGAQAYRYVLLVGLMTLWSAITVSNAAAWGATSINLAHTLADRAPDSPRAQYSLGYSYLVLSRYDPKSPFAAAAYAPLEKAMSLPGASILPEHALIIMNTCCMHQPVKDEWWDSLIRKLKERKTSAQDDGALESLVDCAGRKECDLDRNRMLQAFFAALSHPRPNSRLLAIYGLYAWNVLGDRPLAETLTSDAIRILPNLPIYRITFAKMLLHDGKVDAADQQISALKALNIGGRVDQDLGNLSKLRIQVSSFNPPRNSAVDLHPNTSQHIRLAPTRTRSRN